MPIYSGQTSGLQAVTTSDTTVISTASNESKEVYTATLHNTTADTVSVELFLGNSATSNSGVRIASESLDGGRSIPLRPVTLAPGRYLIAKASAVGVNYFATFTKRTSPDL